MNPADTPPGAPADGPLDDTDLGILEDIRAAFSAADPMPADLPERIRFSLALRDLEYEVARLAAQEEEQHDQRLVTARGAEQSRTVTFDSESLTIMIRIDANLDGTARVDGWLAPPQRREIEMTTSAGSISVTSDEQGRFAFAEVPRGTAQLLARPPREAADRPGRAVVTPALIL